MLQGVGGVIRGGHPQQRKRYKQDAEVGKCNVYSEKSGIFSWMKYRGDVVREVMAEIARKGA